MISSSVHQRKSYTDMSRRGGLVDGEWVVVGWGWGGVYWNTYANGVHHDRTLHYRLYNGLVSDPPHTASRGSHVSNVRRCGRVSFFFFFFLSKSKFTFSPSVSDQASVSLERNLGEKKEGGQRRKAVHYNYSVQKKKCSTINLND